MIRGVSVKPLTTAKSFDMRTPDLHMKHKDGKGL